MNCKEAREIINLLMDGEQHPQADQAHAHVSVCDACAEWQSSTECTVSLISAGEFPEIDLSAAIMSRLPKHHPASQRRKLRIPGRALAWIGACWGAGLLALLVIGVTVSHWLTPARTGDLVIRTYDLARASMSLLAVVLSAGRVVLDAVAQVLPHESFSYLLWFVVLDSIILAAIAAIWFRRKKAHGLFIVVG